MAKVRIQKELESVKVNPSSLIYESFQSKFRKSHDYSGVYSGIVIQSYNLLYIKQLSNLNFRKFGFFRLKILKDFLELHFFSDRSGVHSGKSLDYSG